MSSRSVWQTAIAGLAASAVGFAAIPANAQTVGIGATKKGAVAQITATISKVVSENSGGVQMRKQTMGGTQQYIPVVNAGELAFGISNTAQLWMARNGTGLSKGTKYDNLRMVATMMKFTVGFVVADKSGIKSVSDLKGKRIAHGFKAAPLFQYITAGALATGGVTYKDVKRVPAVGLVQHWRMLMQGKVDAVIAAAGSGFVKQMNAKISGGIRYLSFPEGDASLKKMHKWFPKTFWSEVKPRKGLAGVKAPVNLVSYDYLLWSHKKLSNDVVYKVTKVMHTQAAKLKEGGPLWRSYQDNANLCKKHGIPYHPGALKYYKEAGLCK